jgi:hydroxymethylbilane synthase
MHKNLTNDWIVLTHPTSNSDIGKVIGCYERIKCDVSEAYEENLKSVGACYWTSFPQYKMFLERFPFLNETLHFCGMGKTWQEFKSAGVFIHPVANMQDFYNLTN